MLSGRTWAISKVALVIALAAPMVPIASANAAGPSFKSGPWTLEVSKIELVNIQSGIEPSPQLCAEMYGHVMIQHKNSPEAVAWNGSPYEPKDVCEPSVPLNSEGELHTKMEVYASGNMTQEFYGNSSDAPFRLNIYLVDKDWGADVLANEVVEVWPRGTEGSSRLYLKRVRGKLAVSIEYETYPGTKAQQESLVQAIRNCGLPLNSNCVDGVLEGAGKIVPRLLFRP